MENTLRPGPLRGGPGGLDVPVRVHKADDPALAKEDLWKKKLRDDAELVRSGSKDASREPILIIITSYSSYSIPRPFGPPTDAPGKRFAALLARPSIRFLLSSPPHRCSNLATS